MHSREPFEIEVTRGGLVESRHRVSAAVVDTEGSIVASWGEIGAPVYPRSAIKPLQALPLILEGAADAYHLGAEELALACGSHTGTAAHVAVAEAMREHTGTRFAELACGVHAPSDSGALFTLASRQEVVRVVHNNCIGKHLGMIATARHRNEPVEGYVEATHPVQVRIRAVLARMAGESLDGLPVGVDGCSAPTFALPLSALARAFARLAAPDGLEPALAAACRRIGAAMVAAPLMVAGPGKLSSELIAAGRGAILLKEGAEGVVAAALPAKRLGFALKVPDGAGRAAEVGLVALLRLFGAFSQESERAVRARFEPAVRTWRGASVGVMRPAGGWLDAPPA
jgi:L-asparaginase II